MALRARKVSGAFEERAPGMRVITQGFIKSNHLEIIGVLEITQTALSWNVNFEMQLLELLAFCRKRKKFPNLGGGGGTADTTLKVHLSE